MVRYGGQDVVVFGPVGLKINKELRKCVTHNGGLAVRHRELEVDTFGVTGYILMR